MMFKRIISAVTGLAMAFTMLGAVPAAAEGNVAMPSSATIGSNDVTISGTNSFGTMLAAALTAEQEEQLENNGCNVFSIEMEGNTATVSFETVEDCTLVAAVYDEAGEAMLASGSVEVTADQTEVKLEIDGEIPEYFYLRGFLLDTNVFRPLCTAYESTMYTQEMQELLAMTTDDFDSERVLNFDEDETNNFAVCSEDVIALNSKSGVNKLVSADDEALTYVFENADETLTALGEGDIFTYESSDELLIVKVSSVDASGDTVTIIGQDTEIEDVFDYVKFDTTGANGKMTVDESYCDDGVTYLGSTTQPDTQYYNSKYHSKPLDIEFVDKEKNQEFNLNFNIIEKKSEDEDISNKFNLNVNLKLKFNIKVYISTSRQYFRYKMDYELKGEGSVQTKISSKKKLGVLGFIIPPGIIIELSPSFIAEFSMRLSLSAKINGSFLCQAEHSKKGMDAKIVLSKPEVSSDLKGEATAFLGLSLEPKIKIFDDSIAKTGLEAKVGAEIKMKKTGLTTSDSAVHNCTNCFDGDINFKASAEFSISFLKQEKLTFKRKLAETTIKIADFYWSQDHNEFGFGNCPYNTYKVTIIVADRSKNKIKNADVDISGIKRKTDQDGKVVEYLSSNKYDVKVSAGKKGTAKGSITVKDDAVKKTFYVTLSDKNDSDQDSSDNNPDSDTQDVFSEDSRLSLGYDHSAYITDDGSLYIWGSNRNSELGDGAEEPKTMPTKIVSNVKAVSFGNSHSAYITKKGDLYIWGWNLYGQLGNGTKEDKYTPTKIMSNVKTVSLGYIHSACITENGDLYTWGWNNCGQLGDGTTENKSTPTKIMSNVKAVSLGSSHSACITENGDLYTWGYNDDGQLGYGQLDDYTTKDCSTPTKIMSNVKAVSLGGFHSACITKNDDLYTWGQNYHAQLGCGYGGGWLTTPTKIMSNVKAVNLGGMHSACITKDGDLFTWGYNGNDQLGIGYQSAWESEHTKIMSNVKTVNLGYEHSSCITENGDVYTWGRNDNGQLGDSTNEDKSTPTKITIPSDTSTLSLVSTTFAADTGDQFSGLIPNMIYNIYAMKSLSAAEPFGADNLLYIGQAVSDEDGTIDGEFIPKAETEDMVWFSVPMAQTDISGAKVTLKDLEYSSDEQFVAPKVELDGEALTEGEDYYLTGDYSATDLGDYTVTICGTGMYKGEVEVSYKVIGEKSDDSSSKPDDVSSKTDDSSSKPDSSSSKPDSSSSKPDDSSSKPNETSSKTDSSSSKPDDSSSKPDDGKTSGLGDVNGDGNVDIEDVVMIINHINGVTALTARQEKSADVDKNTMIDIEDAVAVINHINGVKSLDAS